METLQAVLTFLGSGLIAALVSYVVARSQRPAAVTPAPAPPPPEPPPTPVPTPPAAPAPPAPPPPDPYAVELAALDEEAQELARRLTLALRGQRNRRMEARIRAIEAEAEPGG